MDNLKTIKTNKDKIRSNSKVLDAINKKNLDKTNNGKVIVITDKISEVGSENNYVKILSIINSNLNNKLNNTGYYSVYGNEPQSVKTDDCGDFFGRIWEGKTHEEAKEDGKKWLDVSIYQAYKGGERQLNIVTNDKNKFSKEIGIIRSEFKEFDNPNNIGLTDKIWIREKFIFNERKKSELNDSDFSKLPEIRKNAFELVDLFKEGNIKTTYNNLTNLNHHMLVKVLNHNDFFKNFSKKEKEELKGFAIYNK